MKFYKNLYIGDTIRNPGKTRRKLKRYAKRYYRDHPPYVIGIAGNQEEAFGIVCRIAEECVRETGQADLVAYLFRGKQMS